KVQLSAVPGAFHLPRPNWEVIAAWIEQHVPRGDRPQGWSDVIGQWLEALRGALVRPYHVEAADELLLLIPDDFEQADSLVELAEQRLHSWQRPGLDDEEATAMRQYWRAHGLQGFWWGGDFVQPDEGQRYSYRLAQVLLHLLLADYRAPFLPFFSQARAEDAGE